MKKTKGTMKGFRQFKKKIAKSEKREKETNGQLDKVGQALENFFEFNF